MASGDLEGYIDTCFTLANQIPTMSEEDKAFVFAVGLGSPLYAKVWEKDPKTLVEAIRFARSTGASREDRGPGQARACPALLPAPRPRPPEAKPTSWTMWLSYLDSTFSTMKQNFFKKENEK